MAKDDYEVIAYKILVYLYAVMKGKINFDTEVFKATVLKKEVSDEYFAKILKMMQDEGLITEVVLVKVWGSDYIIVSDLSCMEITAQGIRYIKENDEIRNLLMAMPGHIGTLISLIGMR